MKNGKEGTSLDLAGILTMGLVLVIVGGVLGFGLGVWQAPNVRPDLAAPSVDPRVQFYRGAYDVCVYMITSVFQAPVDAVRIECAEKVVPEMATSDWYESESVGYVPPP